MLSSLKVGSVLLQHGTVIPNSGWMLKETFCPGWQAITNVNGDDLDQRIREQNWNFNFIAGSLQGASWGSWSDVAIRGAAIRVLRKATSAQFNGFEITGIHKRNFLGFHYVTVIGHSRHVQRSRILRKMAERIRQAAQPVPMSSPAAPLPAAAAGR